MVIGPNVTGWSQLMDGNMIYAAFTMYDTAFLGTTIAILFFVYQLMLYMKTKNLTLAWVTGVLFASMYITGNVAASIVHPASVWIMMVLLSLEIGAIIFLMVIK
jgi:hypothetical protein